jgi:cellulose synthase/poly-beta-1,6-N-acetylglucosamine synthase-like glycosyltransferase
MPATLITVALWAIGLPLAAMSGYLLLLSAAAALAPRRSGGPGRAPARRFAILVPAHNEELLLPDLLASLGGLDYPADRYRVYVVADNCSDATAALARAQGARVFERSDQTLLGKGHALRWLLERVWAEGDYDAVVVLDADTVVSANFLRVMDGRLGRGERAIQAYYTVRDAAGSRGAGLRALALAAVHYLRPQGREALGGSAGLKGNGMVFAADLARRHPWPASLTEDIEYHLELLLAGERVRFAPDAVVAAEMPAGLRGAQTQNVRWERGRIEMLRRYGPKLLAAALRRRSFMLLDAAVDQLIPPLSLLVGGAGLCLAGGALLGSGALALLGGLALAAQASYLGASLALAGVPWRVCLALLYAPGYLLWKLWLYARVVAGRERQGWVRTARGETR